MISAYARHGDAQIALEIWRTMQQEGSKPNEITFLAVLDACSKLEALKTGKQVHALIISRNLDSSTRIGNSLISLYGKCRSLRDARDVFDGMLRKNVISWTAMAVGHAQCEDPVGGLDRCREMMLQGVRPQVLTFAGILDACRGRDSLRVGVAIHRYARLGRMESDAAVGNALVIMYCKSGDLDAAREVFGNQQREMLTPSWAALIGAYVQHGRKREAIDLYYRLDLEGFESDETVFASVLGACDSVDQVDNFHSRIIACGLGQKIIAANAVITAYGRTGNPDKARDVFAEIAMPNVVSWSALIGAHGNSRDAVKFFELMNLDGVKPNANTFAIVLCACASSGAHEHGRRIHSLARGSPHAENTTVLNAAASVYAKCSRVADASKTFFAIPAKDAVSWNVIISAYAKQGRFEEAVALSRQMQLQGFVPEEVTFVVVLYSCSQSGELDAAWQCFESIVNDYGVVPAREHYVCVIDSLGRAGRTADAEELKDSMPYKANGVALQSLLSACRTQEDNHIINKIVNIYFARHPY